MSSGFAKKAENFFGAVGKQFCKFTFKEFLGGVPIKDFSGVGVQEGAGGCYFGIGKSLYLLSFGQEATEEGVLVFVRSSFP